MIKTSPIEDRNYFKYLLQTNREDAVNQLLVECYISNPTMIKHFTEMQRGGRKRWCDMDDEEFTNCYDEVMKDIKHYRKII